MRGEKFAFFLPRLSRIMLHSSLVKLAKSLIVAGRADTVVRHHHTLTRNLRQKFLSSHSVAPSVGVKENQSTSSKDEMEKFALASKFEGLEKNIW